MKKKLLSILTAGAISAGILTTPLTAYAHGYVTSPASRAYQGAVLYNNGGDWSELYKKYGSAIDEPQSIEGDGSNLNGDHLFPIGGPADGQLASAGLYGQDGLHDFSPLDVQKEGYWPTTDINTGWNDFYWYLTADHPSRSFQFYMTKQGWDPNSPLKRDELENIYDLETNGTHFGSNKPISFPINIPKDRSGYHVILAVWDIEDTTKSFYQAIDVNVDNNKTPKLPIPSLTTFKF